MQSFENQLFSTINRSAQAVWRYCYLCLIVLELVPGYAELYWRARWPVAWEDLANLPDLPDLGIARPPSIANHSAAIFRTGAAKWIYP